MCFFSCIQGLCCSSYSSDDSTSLLKGKEKISVDPNEMASMVSELTTQLKEMTTQLEESDKICKKQQKMNQNLITILRKVDSCYQAILKNNSSEINERINLEEKYKNKTTLLESYIAYLDNEVTTLEKVNFAILKSLEKKNDSIKINQIKYSLKSFKLDQENRNKKYAEKNKEEMDKLKILEESIKANIKLIGLYKYSFKKETKDLEDLQKLLNSEETNEE